MKGSFWKVLANEITEDKIRIYDRATTITSSYIGQKVSVYNGIRFFEVIVLEKMLGHCFGEFAPTRKFPLHKKKNKNGS